MLNTNLDWTKPYQYVRYGRMSSDMQNPRSPEQQFDTIAGVIRRAGYPWVHLTDYRDDGKSGRYMRKRPGHSWESERTLVVAPFSEYSIFYHRLTVDRRGRLFLSYDYWSTYWFYRLDHRGSRRALMMSGDGGVTWKLASGRDLTGYVSR